MDFFKHNENDHIYWLPSTKIGEIKFSFDKIKVYEFYHDYP